MSLKLNKVKIGKVNTERLELPKHLAHLINQANRYSHATRPKNIGKLTELFEQFKASKASKKDITVENWRKWYVKKYPGVIEEATNKISEKLLEMEASIRTVRSLNRRTKNFINMWVKDLVFNKTFNGLNIQNEILRKVATSNGVKYQRASSEQDSQGIDGFINKKSISVKPNSYILDNKTSDITILYSIDDEGNVNIQQG